MMRMHNYKPQCIRDEPVFVPTAKAVVSSVLFAKV